MVQWPDWQSCHCRIFGSQAGIISGVDPELIDVTNILGIRLCFSLAGHTHSPWKWVWPARLAVFMARVVHGAVGGVYLVSQSHTHFLTGEGLVKLAY